MAVIALALGVAGLVRGETSSPPGGGAPPAGKITVTNAVIAVPPKGVTTATASFTIYNTTAQDDHLDSAITGAGSGATVVGGPVRIAAHSSVTARVRIEGVIGTLVQGQDVDVQLTFRTGGTLAVVATVEERPVGAHS